LLYGLKTYVSQNIVITIVVTDFKSFFFFQEIFLNPVITIQVKQIHPDYFPTNKAR